MTDFPILPAIIVDAVRRRGRRLLVPARRPEFAQGGRLRVTVADLRARRVAALGLQGRNPARSSSSRTDRWSPRWGSATSSASTASASSWSPITALLFPLGLLASEKYIDAPREGVHAWFLLLEGAIMGIFLSLDLIAFFVFWEVMLVPMYFLIQGWGSGRRSSRR